MTEVIFTTVHGSNLYGLAHGGSDHDIFIVTDGVDTKAKHYVLGGYDVTEMAFGVFLERVFTGSHQAVEALMSPYKVWEDLRYQAMLDAMRVGGTVVTDKYKRTIRKFCFGDFKRRRHAVRLTQNMKGLAVCGVFNPVMTASEIMEANDLATKYEGDALWESLGFERVSAQQTHPAYGLVST